jgi:hypothetical protein
MVVRGTHNRSQVIEEPDEVKVSRPVLKTNGSGDRFVEFNNFVNNTALMLRVLSPKFANLILNLIQK